VIVQDMLAPHRNFPSVATDADHAEKIIEVMGASLLSETSFLTLTLTRLSPIAIGSDLCEADSGSLQPNLSSTVESRTREVPERVGKSLVEPQPLVAFDTFFPSSFNIVIYSSQLKVYVLCF